MDSGLSTYFGQLETGVGVLDYGRHAVAVDGEEGGLFWFGGCVGFGCIGDVELF